MQGTRVIYLKHIIWVVFLKCEKENHRRSEWEWENFHIRLNLVHNVMHTLFSSNPYKDANIQDVKYVH